MTSANLLQMGTLRLCVLTLAVQLLLASISETAEPRAEPSLEAEPRARSGTLVGRVSVAGESPRIKPLQVFKSRAFCGSRVPNETLLVSADGGLRNAVVILRGLDQRTRGQPAKLVLDNIRCAFAPHVQVAPVGSELLLKNSDPILHTVHARLGSETLFNVGLPKWRQVTKSLDRAGVIRIDCDVLHTWMSAAIVVTDSPYFAISDERGYFSIEGLAAGIYDMEVWHEKLGAKSRRLSVSRDDALSLDVVWSLPSGRKQ
jgi:hypothetical protein